MTTELWIEIQDNLNIHKMLLYLYFQHNGALHISAEMTEYLNEQFPEQWIGHCHLRIGHCDH
jgi:hypothetical protein